MNLIIDQGNTLTKIACFHGDVFLESISFNSSEVDQMMKYLDETVKKHDATDPVKYGIISSVIRNNSLLVNALQSRLTLFELNSKLPLPVKIRYKSPETLGNDRIAAAAGAVSLYPNTDLLVIDAGTCITYDFTSRNHEFIGGGISPGITMRFKALHTFTGNLPLTHPENNPVLIGDSTINSIRSGVVNGILAEVEGIMNRYLKQFPELWIIFTGGDLNYFDKYLKSHIFAVPNLVLTGLNEILKHNLKQ